MKDVGLVEPDPIVDSGMLLDGIVENYKPALDELSLEIADLENEVIANPAPQTLNKVVQIKKEVLHLRQIIGPQREVLEGAANGVLALLDKEPKSFLD